MSENYEQWVAGIVGETALRDMLTAEKARANALADALKSVDAQLADARAEVRAIEARLLQATMNAKKAEREHAENDRSLNVLLSMLGPRCGEMGDHAERAEGVLRRILDAEREHTAALACMTESRDNMRISADSWQEAASRGQREHAAALAAKDASIQALSARIAQLEHEIDNPREAFGP